MKTRYIPAVTMLSAGAVISIISIIKKWDVLYSLKLLLGILILFYILGLIAKALIVRTLEKDGRVPEEYNEDGEKSDEAGAEEGTNAENATGEAENEK